MEMYGDVLGYMGICAVYGDTWGYVGTFGNYGVQMGLGVKGGL